MNSHLPLLMATCLFAAVGVSQQSRAQTVQGSPSGDARVNLDQPQSADDGAPTGQSATDIAKELQNPIGTIISVPFQNNINFNVGPHKGTQDILNIQPVIPFPISDYWNIITRTIAPLIWNPSFEPASSVPFGLGPISFSAFLSPKEPVDGWVWGVGPIVQLPTATNKSLGSNLWGGGPAVVVVKLAGPIVAGALVNTVFSAGGTSGAGGSKYTFLTINPFVNYNFGGGWFVGTVPIITANLDAGGAKWTLPVGGQFGRLIKVGNQPLNLLAGAYYNAIRPNGGGTWQLRSQIAFVF